MDQLEQLEGGDEDDINRAVKIANFAPSNLHEPVQTRWGSVSDSIQFFADNWVVIYFFTRTLISTGKCNSQLTKTACCALLSLMYNYEVTPTRDFDDMDLYIESFASEDTSELETSWTKRSPTPILQAVLYFLDGFVANYFTGKQQKDIQFHYRVAIAVNDCSHMVYCCVSPLPTDMFSYLKINDPYLTKYIWTSLAAGPRAMLRDAQSPVGT
jgi:hypothetical protein